MTRFIIILLFACLFSQAFSQNGHIRSAIPDSVLEKQHSPTRASVYSAVLPGLGQIYNKKYWKVPIIYAGFGVFAYFIVNYANDYIDYHSAYIEKVYHAQHGNYKWLTDKYNESQLLSGSESARRNMEINIILSAVWYILNILDATVDAHLFTYNISKDLAIQATPAAMAIDPLHMASPGIKLSLTFK